jgi:hypothetical protein
MSIRRFVLIMVALVAGGGALPAQQQARIVYAPGSHRYHLLSVITRVQDPEGQKIQVRVTTEQEVSVKLTARSKDTLDFSYTLDSSSITSNAAAQLPDLSKMRGTTITGTMSPTGKVYHYQSSAGAESDASGVLEGMKQFLLPLPAGAAVGKSWTDTTLSSVKREGSRLDLRSIMTYTVAGDTTYAGQKAWPVRSTSVTSLQGHQSQSGQQLQVEGSGTGSRTYYISTSGVYLGSSATDNMRMVITLPGTGQTVPVAQTLTWSVELVPGT